MQVRPPERPPVKWIWIHLRFPRGPEPGVSRETPGELDMDTVPAPRETVPPRKWIWIQVRPPREPEPGVFREIPWIWIYPPPRGSPGSYSGRPPRWWIYFRCGHIHKDGSRGGGASSRVPDLHCGSTKVGVGSVAAFNWHFNSTWAGCLFATYNLKTPRRGGSLLQRGSRPTTSPTRVKIMCVDSHLPEVIRPRRGKACGPKPF